MQMVMALQQQGFPIIFLNNSNTLFSSMNEDTRERLLNLESNIKENIISVLFFSRKKGKTLAQHKFPL
jgi:predicted HAD superfamily phosphohydrolase YqeG